jgi:hypothetical protein
VFVSQAISHRVIKCNTSPEDTPPKADHFPIHITIDFSIQEAIPKIAWNFRKTDWAKFRERLSENMLITPSPPQILTSAV